MLGCLLEAGDVHITDAGTNQEMLVHAVARNLVANNIKFQGLVGAFAQNCDANRGPLRSLQQVGHVRRAHVVGGFAIHGDDDVPRMNAGAISGRADKWRNHDDFIVARAHRHAHAVILAALLLAEQGIRLGIEKVRMRIERVQHSRDRPVVDGLLRVHGLGIVGLDDLVHLSELLQAVFNVGIAGCGCLGVLLRQQHADKATKYEKKNNQE